MSAVVQGHGTGHPEVDPNRIWRAAMAYARAGKPVLPVHPVEKVPLTRGGVHAATTDPHQLGRWWRDFGDRAAIAMATGEPSGVDVLDVDLKTNGHRSMVELTGAHGKLPPTTCAITQSGGRHHYFAHQPGLLNRIGGRRDIPEGLDCRTTGGYVLLPPSPGYRFERILASGQPLPAWPDWLAGRFKERVLERHPLPLFDTSSLTPERLLSLQRHARAIIDGACRDVREARPGSQEATLNGAALRVGRVAASGAIDRELALGLIRQAGLQMQSEPGRRPWTERDVTRKCERSFAQGEHQGIPRDLDWTSSRADRRSPGRER